uniref:sodium-driven chloride bicarbonate exchanger-like n=1 Tax=Myxine glutinosa TaxID=7769 RepID=UPI00358E47EA
MEREGRATVKQEEEAVVDRRTTNATLLTNFEEEDLDAHRTVYIGLHVPSSRRSRRRRRHHGHRRHRQPELEPEGQDGHESAAHGTPSQRVQFLLGLEDYDEEHIPHDLFIQLDELCLQDGEYGEWKETARWLKFEEHVEDGGERWSKPYVASLSLHSLFELRHCITNGTVLFDLKADSLEEIVDVVVEDQISSQLLNESMRERVKDVLLQKHHHQSENKLRSKIPIMRSFADISKKHSESPMLDKNRLSTSPQPPSLSVEAEMKDGEPPLSVSHENINVDFSKVDHSFMKKIPPGAEASNVFVGELQYLEQLFVAFVRLSPTVLLSGITEVPIPSRFLFILLGPPGRVQQYHEIGRSIATLMSDEIFHDVAYKAKDRSDLLAGIDEFLDLVTVLPPGEWDPSIRIEPPKNIPSQEKRKIPSVANGAAPVSEPEYEPHEVGPELQRTGHIFGGLVQDVKRKAPWYLSDYRDGLNLQCLASFLFLYCACMSPVITFGGLLGEATEERISAIESLLGASMTGMVYSLFGGQPLTILGSTGPVLIFEKILFKFCK